MKKNLFFVALAVLLNSQVFAQPLTGTKTIPGNYATLALAIADLNTKGVGSGGVTFNITPGYTETFLTPTAGHITTLTGSVTNQIVFQKSGSGPNPVITAPTGIYDGTSNPLPVTMDAIIAIGGCDYITFDGINLSEKLTNIEPTTQMEWGFAILKASGINGSQNITIKNCTITLNKENYASKGIYSENHTIADLTQFAVTDSAGANSNLKIFGNTVSNSCQGIYLSGYNDPSAPYAFYDLNNQIGVDGPNIITDFGGAPGVVSGIFTKYQNNLKVANNTVTSTTINYDPIPSIANLYGINLSTAYNASFDLYGNTVSLNFEAADGYNSSLFGIYTSMGANGTNNIANIYNNSVTNCTFPTPISGNAYYMYFYSMGVTANVYGNTVSNNLYGSNSTASTGNIRYLYIQHLSTTKGTLTVYNNNITGNLRRQSATGQGSTDMLNVIGSGTIMKTYNNLIDQIDVRANGSTHCLYIYYNDEISKDIYNNTVTNITNANGSVTGLQNGNGTLGRIYNNKIQKISAAADASYAFISGINHISGTNMYYYNNMVSELNSPASVGSMGYDWNMLCGINITVDQYTNSVGFYNNTVYINSPVTSAEFGSAAIFASSLYGVDIRNNILINTSASAGNGKTVGIFVRSTSYSGFTSNYNNIYAGTPGGSRQIFRYGTGGTYAAATTLNDYKLLVTPQELQSVTENTPFVNVTTSPYDVHVKTEVATQCEAGGFTVSSPLAITTDFDGDARFPNTGYPVNGSFTPNAPDIGADEFGGLANDITPPAIVYTPLLNTNSLLPRTLTATITDGSGVPATPGNIGLPVLNWKLNSGSYQAVQGTFNGNNAYSFTFGAANAVNDVISYYIVAQDMASTPHSGAYPWVGASGFSINPPACSVPPAPPASYTIVLGIQGVFHVGVGKNYTTLTSAAADLTNKSITGPVTFILDDNTYPSETYPIIFNANAGSSATNTVTIKPNTGASPVFTGSVPGSGLIKFKGLDHVTIDGSNNGSTSQNTTFQNTSSSSSAHTIGITNSTSGDPSTNVTLKNCIIIGQNSEQDQNTYLIMFNENGGVNGGGYNDCVITGNTLKKAKFGIDITATLDKRNYNIVISNNTIGSTDPSSYISRYGIAVELSDNTLISGNDVMGNADGATGMNMFPIFGIMYYNNCTNTKVTRNKVHDWYALGPGSYGIRCHNGASTTVNEVSNNLVYDIKCMGTNPGVGALITYGMYIRDGGNMKIWNNTIYLSGPYLAGTDSYQPSSGCIGIQEWTTNQYDIRGNIFRNSMTNPSPNPGPLAMGKAYGIMINASTEANAAAKFSQLNYNDYYIDGYKGCIGQWFGTGGIALVNYETLQDWQTFTGKDQNAITDNPVFVSNLDLHPTNPVLNSVGGPQLLPVDYAGSTRYNPTDMGAWEWSLPVSVINTLAATDVAQTTATLSGSINTNSEYCNIWFEYGTSTSYGSVATPVPSSVRSVGTLLSSTIGITGLAPNTIYHYRFAGDPTTSAQANVYGEDMTFTTLAGSANKTLNLTLFLEGLYAGAGIMNKVQNGTGDQFPGSVADKVTVELHNATAPYATAYSYSNTDLNTNGTLTINTITGTITGSYYIVIKHRNSIETWSKVPLSFTGPGPFSYNFSSAATQAYGDNMRLMGTVYAIWGADVNQDGIVDTGDMNSVENESTLITQGYVAEDVNGDGIVDTSDMNYVENNSTAFILVKAP